MVKAANFQLYCLSRIKQCPTPEALRMAVYLLVSSRVDLLLDGLPKTQVNKLQHVINCAARMVLGVGRFKHVTPILESLHWLPVEYQIKYKVLCLAYKLLHGLAPAYLADLSIPYVSEQSLHSAELNLLAVLKTRSSMELMLLSMQPQTCLTPYQGMSDYPPPIHIHIHLFQTTFGGD